MLPLNTKDACGETERNRTLPPWFGATKCPRTSPAILGMAYYLFSSSIRSEIALVGLADPLCAVFGLEGNLGFAPMLQDSKS